MFFVSRQSPCLGLVVGCGQGRCFIPTFGPAGTFLMRLARRLPSSRWCWVQCEFSPSMIWLAQCSWDHFLLPRCCQAGMGAQALSVMLAPAGEKQGAHQPRSTAWSVLLAPAEGSRRSSSLLQGRALGAPPAAAWREWTWAPRRGSRGKTRGEGAGAQEFRCLAGAGQVRSDNSS